MIKPEFLNARAGGTYLRVTLHGFLSFGATPPSGLIHEVSRSHTTTEHSR